MHCIVVKLAAENYFINNANFESTDKTKRNEVIGKKL